MEKKEKSFLIGIDDAGRGPLIGPMCLAGVLIYKEVEEELRRAGIKDSKLLTPKKREELFSIIKQMILDYHTYLLSPSEIDTGMGEGLNLNEVEALASANIINHLVDKLTEEQKKDLIVIIDCPSTNRNAWTITVRKYLKDKNLNIRAEHKADFHYPVVSASSILAKVTRDAEIEKLKGEIGIDIGSGYPADPTTKKALEKHFEILKSKRLIRESWSTWKNFEKNKNDKEKQKGLGEF